MHKPNESQTTFPEFINPKDLPYSTIQYRGKLPHLFKEGGTYFVTFRLGDAVIKKSSNHHQKREISKLTAEEIFEFSEPAIQQGMCILKEKSIAEMIQNALLFFHKERYYLYAWCIMPNHVHTVVSPFNPYSLSAILHTWKSFTAKEINKSLGTSGVIWERESFNHLVRNEEYLKRFIDYIEYNPVKAGLCNKPEEWLFSSASVKL